MTGARSRFLRLAGHRILGVQAATKKEKIDTEDENRHVQRKAVLQENVVINRSESLGGT